MIIWTRLRKSAFFLVFRPSHYKPAVCLRTNSLALFCQERISKATGTTTSSDLITITAPPPSYMAPPLLTTSVVEGLLEEIGADSELKLSTAQILAAHLKHSNISITCSALPELALSVKEHLLNVDISRQLSARNEVCADAKQFLSAQPMNSHDTLFALAFSTALIAIEGSRGVRQQAARFVASAIASEIDSFIRQLPEVSNWKLGSDIIFTLISSDSITADLHIVAALAKALHVDSCPSSTEASMIAKRITPELGGHNKTTIAAALALSSQLQPWEALPPTELLRVAIENSLWHAAERITEAAVASPSWSETTTVALIDAAYRERSFRKANTYATRFFANGGYSRLLDARFMHASDSIQKIAAKGGLHLIERQSEIIESTISQIREYYKEIESCPPTQTFHGAATMDDAVDKIRQLALYHLEQVGERVGIAHLANVWGLEHNLDPATLQAARAERIATFIQWHELMGNANVPEVIVTPETLLASFQQLLDDQSPFYGFDAEWGEDEKGVALLQIASLKRVVLVDIPLLSETERGVQALKDTIGKCFEDPSTPIIGFACKGDVSKMKLTPCVGKMHWMGSVNAVLDLQVLVRTTDINVGLSRCCELYLGKPLDKLEQCSAWMKRPLSLSQRTYAALDALACVLIYQKLLQENRPASGQ